MDRQDTLQLHERASESYLRGDYREALAAWQSVLRIDPGDEQALEGVRLAAMLAEGSPNAMPPMPDVAFGRSDPAELRRRIDEVDARMEAGDLQGAAGAAEALAAEFPSDPSVLEAQNRARIALEAEPFIQEQLVLANAGLVAGRIVEAEAACRRILSVDPHHFEATNLLRQCGSAAGAGDPHATDLAVLDTLSTRLESARPPAGAPQAPPAGAAPAVPAAREETPPAGGDAAAAELKRRVSDLLEEARQEETSGRVDEALAILSRVFILDEQNEEAVEMEERLRAIQGQSSRDVENWLAEGVESYEKGRLDEARTHFRNVLDRYPGHIEALDYLEKTDSALAAREGTAFGGAAGTPLTDFQGEDLLQPAPRLEEGDANTPTGPRTFAAEPLSAAILLQERAAPADPILTALHRSSGRAEADLDLAAATPARSAAPRRSSLPWPLLAGVGLLVAVVAVGAILFFVVPMIRGKSSAASPPARAKAEAKPAPKPRPTTAAAPAPAPMPGVKSASEAMARAKAAVDAGDYAAAVIAYNAALTLDPGFDEARTGLALAGEQYKAQKAEREQIDRAKTMFAEGEFTPALKILYRIPEGRYAAEIERHKANAWFNNGLVSLRAGNCKEAQEHFAEALQIRPGDPDVLRARNMAQRFQAAPKDRAFYDAAEGIPFRKFDE